MKFIFKIFIPVFLLGILAAGEFEFASAQTQEKLTLNFFYSETCSHCKDEHKFLDGIEGKYPNLTINRYSIKETDTITLLKEMTQKYNAERYLGLVPLTFIGEDFFVGFDNPKGIGKEIESSIQRQLQIEKPVKDEEVNQKLVRLPILGDIDMAKYSLPVLAVLLGFLDGFNVCSLGALVLILGLVLVLKSRKKILLFGGTFILTTAVIYGLLIVLWFKLFSALAPYIKILELLVGLLAIGGSIYFFKEFIRFKKYGPTCNTADQKLTSRLSNKIQKTFENPKTIFALLGGVFVFAAAITIIEFPCSAAIPVVFAGVLSQAQLPGALSFLYIALFILFYMLDELIVFLIAASKMQLWLASPKFTTWITLIEAIILGALGFYYLFGIF